MEKDATRIYLAIFIVSILIYIPEEVLYYTGITIPISDFITGMSFIVLGFSAAIVSLILYRHLTYRDISMVIFLLRPKKLLQEVKVLFYGAITGVVGNVIAESVGAIFRLNPTFTNFSMYFVFKSLTDSFFLSSTIFAMICIVIFYRWGKRLKEYE